MTVKNFATRQKDTQYRTKVFKSLNGISIVISKGKSTEKMNYNESYKKTKRSPFI